MIGLGCTVGADEPTIRALNIPANERFRADTDARQVSIEGDGRVTAITMDASGHTAVFGWRTNAVRDQFRPVLFSDVPHTTDLDDLQFDSLASDATGTYVNAEESGSGATLFAVAQIERWSATKAENWHGPLCRPSVTRQNETIGGSHGDGELALTRDFSIADGDSRLEPRDAPGLSPYAFAIRGSTCAFLGRGVVRAIRGRWAGGYRTYAGDHLASILVAELGHRVVAVRWGVKGMTELGTGRIFAISSSGFAVGAIGSLAGGWREDGAAVIFDRDEDGMAHDVADDGTVVGTIIGRAGVTYAFRWKAGHFMRLDDSPHPSGWHFASAYAINADGVIVGTGTLKGEPVVFTWHE